MNTILVIDDDDAFRRMISAILQQHGHQVIEASDGLAGVKLARTAHPDLILCDINMGRLDGHAAASVLRLHPATATVPLVMMTGRATFGGMRHSMSLGADDYLAKPFGESELMAAVNMQLQKRREKQREAEREMADLQVRLPQRLSQELLTPLNGILAVSEVLSATCVTLDRNEVQQIAGDLRASARRLRRQLLNYLLYVELSTLGADEPRRKAFCQGQPTAVAAVVKAAAWESAERWSRTRDLELDFVDGCVAMTEDQLRKVVDQLVDNACKFSAAGTKVQVSTSVKPSFIEFAVQDQGRGMTPDQIAQAGAYLQFDRNQNRQQGLGLGLVIARQLAELNGGTLSIQSIPVEGTWLQVRLPVFVA